MEAAFEKFVATLQNYYDSTYYVDWEKVHAKVQPYRRELLLLTSLCTEANKEKAARELLRDYPRVIAALPVLMACRNSIEIVENAAEAHVTTYDFKPAGERLTEDEVEHYVEFLTASGLLSLLERIKSVPDYVTGVEVGMDTNARKNRGGHCGMQAIRPFIEAAQQNLPGLEVKFEAGFDFLSTQGFVLPEKFRGIVWDVAFWTRARSPRLTVMEVNHYGTSGGKPSAIAREYTGRQTDLDATDIGFIWVTDGRGWLNMLNPLREAFNGIRHLVNIRLAKDGQLEWALRRLLYDDIRRRKEHAA